jgi:hypothetical protein
LKVDVGTLGQVFFYKRSTRPFHTHQIRRELLVPRGLAAFGWLATLLMAAGVVAFLIPVSRGTFVGSVTLSLLEANKGAFPWVADYFCG